MNGMNGMSGGPQPSYRDAITRRHTRVVGFHGTSRTAVPHLLAGNIEPSDQHFEWLGTDDGHRLSPSAGKDFVA